MKKLFLLILLPFITFAQEAIVGELQIVLNNYGSSWNITFTLTAIGARWDANYDLTENYETVSVNISSPVTEALFDHILDPSPNNPEFAVGLYKISAIENSVEQAYFYMDWRTSDWSTSLDVIFKYDVGNKRFRDEDDTQTIDYSYQTLWDLTGNLLETTGLEDYWNNCLAVINGNGSPKSVWGPHPDDGSEFDVELYNIYRAVPPRFFIHINCIS